MKFRTILCSLLAIVSASLLAQAPPGGGGQSPPPGGYVPGYNQPMPYYFFGTYNEASGRAVISTIPPPFCGPPYIQEAKLFVGGEPVRHYIYHDGDPLSNDMTLKVAFDSTHFLPSTNVQVRVWAQDIYGLTYEGTGSADVKNRALAYTFPDLPTGGVLSAFTHFTNLHYDTHLVGGSGHSWTTLPTWLVVT